MTELQLGASARTSPIGAGPWRTADSRSCCRACSRSARSSISRRQRHDHESATGTTRAGGSARQDRPYLSRRPGPPCSSAVHFSAAGTTRLRTSAARLEPRGFGRVVRLLGLGDARVHPFQRLVTASQLRQRQRDRLAVHGRRSAAYTAVASSRARASVAQRHDPGTRPAAARAWSPSRRDPEIGDWRHRAARPPRESARDRPAGSPGPRAPPRRRADRTDRHVDGLVVASSSMRRSALRRGVGDAQRAADARRLGADAGIIQAGMREASAQRRPPRTLARRVPQLQLRQPEIDARRRRSTGAASSAC